MPKHRDLQSLTKLLKKNNTLLEFKIQNALPVLFNTDQFTPETMWFCPRF